MKKMIMILGLILTTNAAMAGYTEQPNIKRIYTYQDYAIVYFDKAFTTKCAAKTHLKIMDIRDTGKAIYATALSAKQAGNKVSIGHVDDKCGSWGSQEVGIVYSIIIND